MLWFMWFHHSVVSETFLIRSYTNRSWLRGFSFRCTFGVLCRERGKWALNVQHSQSRSKRPKIFKYMFYSKSKQLLFYKIENFSLTLSEFSSEHFTAKKFQNIIVYYNCILLYENRPSKMKSFLVPGKLFENFHCTKGCKNEFKNNFQKSCSWSRNKISDKVGFKSV